MIECHIRLKVGGHTISTTDSRQARRLLEERDRGGEQVFVEVVLSTRVQAEGAEAYELLDEVSLSMRQQNAKVPAKVAVG